MVPVPLSTLIPLPFHSLNMNDSAAHFSMISARPTWILSCLSAPSVISSMYYSGGLQEKEDRQRRQTKHQFLRRKRNTKRKQELAPWIQSTMNSPRTDVVVDSSMLFFAFAALRRNCWSLCVCCNSTQPQEHGLGHSVNSFLVFSMEIIFCLISQASHRLAACACLAIIYFFKPEIKLL